MADGAGAVSDAQTDFGDVQFQPPEHTWAQDWDRLAAHLSRAGLTLDADPAPRQFRSGLGNVNYLISVDGALAVLRRPPPGPIPPGANDMGREARVLTALHPHLPLVPKCIHYCESPEVLGAHFLIMDYRPGIVIRETMPEPHRTAEAGVRLCRMLIDVLGDFHALEPATVGLDTLGKPEGFLPRTIAGWAKRGRLAYEGAQPETVKLERIERIVAWLEAQPSPPAQAPTLMHNDFKLDNLILDPETLDPRAIIDWDMGSRGDPLFDAAVMLSYYTEKDDPEIMQALGQYPSTEPGFLSREDMVAAYALKTGRDTSGFKFYRVLSVFRLAVVYLQLFRRYKEGSAADDRFENFDAMTEGMLAFCEDIIADRYF